MGRGQSGNASPARKRARKESSGVALFSARYLTGDGCVALQDAYWNLMMRLLACVFTVLVAFSSACGSTSQGPTGAAAPTATGQARLTTVADVQLPGDTSRWDYQSLDPQSHRLFFADLGAGEVVVYDTQRAAMVGTVRGVAFAPGAGKVYLSGEKDG